VRILAGVRWDDAEEWGSEVSPRVSVGWQVATNVELRAGYGRAFRQPSIGELYFPFSGNPELEAERSESSELGLVWFAGSTRLQTNFFNTTVDNLIEFDYATYAFANVSTAKMQGVEVAWDVPLTGELLSQLQATWLDTEGDGGQALLRRPEWSGSWMVQGRLWTKLRGDLTLLWIGSRADVDPVTFQRVELGSHLTANLGLGFELHGAFELLLRVQNLADESYQEIAGYPAPGRRVTGGLRFRL
jgi:vitamin B12 transporter